MDIVNKFIDKLTEESKGNLNDISNITNSYPFELKSDKLESLFDDIKRSYDNYNNINIINTRRFNPKSDDSIKLLRDIFTVDGLNNRSSTVYKEYNKLNKYYEKRLEYGDIRFKLKFYFKDNSSYIIPIIKRFDCIMRLYENTSRFNHIRSCMQDNTFEIYFLLYPVNRETPSNRTTRPYTDLQKLKSNGTYNCSSGYTSFFNSNHHILVTRIPESLGLLVHELGHLLGWDLSTTVKNEDMCTISGMVSKHIFTDEQEIYLKRLPLENRDIVPSEAFCNTYSTIIHSICNTLELGGNFYDFINILKDEIMYSIYHSAKILYYLGYNSYKDFFMTPDNKLRYIQSAYLFEYTILRSFMLINLGMIMDLGFEPKNVNNILNIALKGITTYNREYEKIFNDFISKIREKDILNMEYFAYDISIHPQLGGFNVNYYDQYIKYKRKYLEL